MLLMLIYKRSSNKLVRDARKKEAAVNCRTIYAIRVAFNG